MILIYIFFFSIWLRSIYVKYGFNISAFLISLYLIGSMLCGAIMVFYPDYIKHYDRITLASVSTHIAILFLLMYPIIRYGNSIKVENIHISLPTLRLFGWFVVICSISSIIASLFDILKLFALGNFQVIRNNYLAGNLDMGSPAKRYGIIGYVIAMGPLLSFTATFLFFYLKFYLKQSNLLVMLLLVSTFTMAMNNLTIAGRDGIIRTILFYIANYTLFKKYISLKNNRLYIYLIAIFALISVIFFSAISNDRFKQSERGIFFSLIRYGGEQFYLYSYNHQRFHDKGMESFETMLPLIYGDSYIAHDLNTRAKADFYLNTFATIAGSFVQRIGVINTVLFSCAVFISLLLIFYRKYKYTPHIGLAKIITFLLFYEIVLLGFFYYIHYSSYVQKYMLISIILAYLVTHYGSRKKFSTLLNQRH